MTLTFSMQIINYPFFFLLIGEEKYHKRKNVYKEQWRIQKLREGGANSLINKFFFLKIYQYIEIKYEQLY